MTVLMGFKTEDGVVFTADMKRNDVTAHGENMGTFNKAEKIYQIHPHMIIAIAGLASVGEATTAILKSAIGINEDISVSDSLNYVQETFQYTYDLFKRVNPHVSYLPLVAFIGGYDLENLEPYMYTISSEDNFNLTKQMSKFICIGPNNDFLNNQALLKLPNCNTVTDIVNTFSEIIRDVDAEDVSKETFSKVSFYLQDEGYKVSNLYLNENGRLV